MLHCVMKQLTVIESYRRNKDSNKHLDLFNY